MDTPRNNPIAIFRSMKKDHQAIARQTVAGRVRQHNNSVVPPTDQSGYNLYIHVYIYITYIHTYTYIYNIYIYYTYIC